MKITEYPVATDLESSNVFLIDGPNGTKQIPASNLPFELLEMLPPQVHRTIFRGKNLGGALTATQKESIQNGTFKDLWLGDYWVIGGHNWRIADIDYWLHCSSPTPFESHHLVILPDDCVMDAQMNTSNTTSGGYLGSYFYNNVLPTVKTVVSGAFGESVLSHYEYLSNGSNMQWTKSTVEIANEMMMYGTKEYSSDSPATISKNQLALLAACPEFLNIRHSQWLRDIAGQTIFTYCTTDCTCMYGVASESHGIRPVFAIG